MLCYDPLESKLGPKVHGAPNFLIEGLVPPDPFGSGAYGSRLRWDSGQIKIL